ncbi:MAG: MFS transporter [Verrucomicrobiota bacterium]|nr:MFS transporter [Verrucomicrobiota bacterium]
MKSPPDILAGQVGVGNLDFPPRKGAVIKHLRWYMVALLFLATFLNYLDRQTLSVAAPTICKELHFSEIDYSHIVMAFLVAYMIMQAMAGWAIDRLRVRLGFAVAVAMWSLACVGHAFARGVRSFALCRFLLGAAEAGNFPAGIRAVGEWFPASERSGATGIFTAGSGLGAIVAPPIVAWLILHYGWQSAFVVTGVVGFLWLIPWLWLYYDPERHPHLGAAELAHIRRGQEVDPAKVAADSKARWIDILKRREFWGIFIGRMLTDPVWWFYVFWLPKYLSTARGFDLTQIAMFAWVPFLGSGIFSSLGGFMPTLFMKRGMSVLPARKLAMCISAAVMPVALLAAFTSNPYLAILFITVATSGHPSWAASLLTLPADLFPKHQVASTYGLTGAGGTFGGIIMSWVVGEILQRQGYTPVLVMMGSLHIIAAVVVLVLVRPRESPPVVKSAVAEEKRV